VWQGLSLVSVDFAAAYSSLRRGRMVWRFRISCASDSTGCSNRNWYTPQRPDSGGRTTSVTGPLVTHTIPARDPSGATTYASPQEAEVPARALVIRPFRTSVEVESRSMERRLRGAPKMRADRAARILQLDLPAPLDRPASASSRSFAQPSDEVERREVAPTSNEAGSSRSSIHSLAYRRRSPAIARTGC
jgi:hypothetical protein